MGGNKFNYLPLDPDGSLTKKLNSEMTQNPEIQYRKFLHSEPTSVTKTQVNNYFMFLCFVLAYVYFMITKEYLVLFDLILFLPFLAQYWTLFSQSPAAVLIVVVGIVSYAGMGWMWVAWQYRMIANVNNYWTQIFINSLWYAFMAYVIQSRIRQKCLEYEHTFQFYFDKIKYNVNYKDKFE